MISGKKYSKVLIDESALNFYRFVKERVDIVLTTKRGEIDDNVVLEAEQKNALIITSDKGFKEYHYENIIIVPNNGKKAEDTLPMLEKILTKTKANTLEKEINCSKNNGSNGKRNNDINNRYKKSVPPYR